MTPKNDITELLALQFKNYNYTANFTFDTKKKLLDYMASPNYMEDVCLGIAFD